jgi:hypothetical protein
LWWLCALSLADAVLIRCSRTVRLRLTEASDGDKTLTGLKRIGFERLARRSE